MKKFIFSVLTSLFFTTTVLAETTIVNPKDRVLQGSYLTIEIKEDSAQDKEFFASFNNKTVKMYKNNKGKYICFIGIPADLKTGGYKLRIKENDKLFYENQIEVEPKYTGKQYISYYKPKLSKEEENKIQEEEKLVENAKNTRSEKQYWEKPFMLPVNDYVSAIYGIKRYLNGKYNNYHTGVDFASDMGQKVKAINSGKIILAKYFSKYNSNGNIVYIDHGLGIGSAYLHLSKILVKEGDIVEKGQVIGLVGSTGRSTGPHLHWGVYLNGQNTDGLNLVKSIK
ncbi:MAG: M23 family metallopeptidase [Candidatus Sericytochromatia bacterium]